MAEFIATTLLIILFIVLGSLAVSCTWYVGNRLDAGEQRAWEQERPSRVAKCENYGKAFEVQTKYDDTYGCLRKTSEGWVAAK